jgi:hypothetical protein
MMSLAHPCRNAYREGQGLVRNRAEAGLGPAIVRIGKRSYIGIIFNIVMLAALAASQPIVHQIEAKHDGLWLLAHAVLDDAHGFTHNYSHWNVCL